MTERKIWKKSEIYELANEIGYPKDIQDMICEWVYENHENEEEDEDRIRESLVYYYIENDNDVYYDILSPLWAMSPCEVHPMTENDFVYEKMCDELAMYNYHDFDTSKKIEAIANEVIKNMVW